MEYPKIRYNIVNDDSIDIMEHLDKGLIDFAILLDPVNVSKYNYIKLTVKDVWGVLIRKDCELATKDNTSPKDL